MGVAILTPQSPRAQTEWRIQMAPVPSSSYPIASLWIVSTRSKNLFDTTQFFFSEMAGRNNATNFILEQFLEFLVPLSSSPLHRAGRAKWVADSIVEEPPPLIIPPGLTGQSQVFFSLTWHYITYFQWNPMLLQALQGGYYIIWYYIYIYILKTKKYLCIASTYKVYYIYILCNISYTYIYTWFIYI